MLETAFRLFISALVCVGVVAASWSGILLLTHYFPVHFACYSTGNTPPPEPLIERK